MAVLVVLARGARASLAPENINLVKGLYFQGADAFRSQNEAPDERSDSRRRRRLGAGVARAPGGKALAVEFEA